MTSIHVLGSGSRGNCIAIECDGAILLVDAGFSAREIERRAAATGVSLDRVVGIVVTHEHTDHISGAARLSRRLATPVITATGTWGAMRERFSPTTVHRPIALGAQVELSPFVIRAAPTSHDAAEPLALAVLCADGERVGLAYDMGRTTSGVRFLLRDMSALVVEANHDELRLRTCGYPPSVQQRIAGSTGHLSNRAAAALLAELCHPGLGLIVLAHLSEQSNEPAEALRAVEPTLERAGFNGVLHVAKQDEPLAALSVVGRDAQLGLGL